jgi:hypothetical protein
MMAEETDIHLGTDRLQRLRLVDELAGRAILIRTRSLRAAAERRCAACGRGPYRRFAANWPGGPTIGHRW